MRILERCATLVEAATTLGPANVVGLLIATCFSGLFLAYRLLSQGYYRCFLSSR